MVSQTPPSLVKLASRLAEVMIGSSFASPRTVKATLVLVTSLAVPTPASTITG